MRWPDNESLQNEYIEQFGYKNPKVYRCHMNQFRRFIGKRSPQRGLTEQVFRSWIRTKAKRCTQGYVVRQTEFLNGFLDWLVHRQVISAHPLQHLKEKYECRSVRALTIALISPEPDRALQALRPLPRYGSHLGNVIREHIQRMRTLGCRYGHEHAFLHFDRFLQRRTGADRESLDRLIREYVSTGRSINAKLRRLVLGRIVVRALNRQGSSVAVPRLDRLLLTQDRNQRLRPHIYSELEIERLLKTAREYPSPRSGALRPLALYTMLTLAYCAGLRLGEIVRLKLRNIDLASGAIEICDSKFFKSRRLPLSASGLSVLRDYLQARRKAKAPQDPESSVFWHNRGYGYSTAGHLLYNVIRRSGIRTKEGKPPRVHDLRHTFTVHRLTSWYRDGIQPESKLPYLSAYLGHRNIQSTLVYLTMTDELLERASQRFRAAESQILEALRGES